MVLERMFDLYVFLCVCVSGAAEPMLNLHRHGKCEKLYFCCEFAIRNVMGYKDLDAAT